MPFCSALTWANFQRTHRKVRYPASWATGANQADQCFGSKICARRRPVQSFGFVGIAFRAFPMIVVRRMDMSEPCANRTELTALYIVESDCNCSTEYGSSLTIERAFWMGVTFYNCADLRCSSCARGLSLLLSDQPARLVGAKALAGRAEGTMAPQSRALSSLHPRPKSAVQGLPGVWDSVFRTP